MATLFIGSAFIKKIAEDITGNPDMVSQSSCMFSIDDQCKVNITDNVDKCSMFVDAKNGKDGKVEIALILTSLNFSRVVILPLLNPINFVALLTDDIIGGKEITLIADKLDRLVAGHNCKNIKIITKEPIGMFKLPKTIKPLPELVGSSYIYNIAPFDAKSE